MSTELPRGVALGQIYRDLFEYLLKNTCQYFIDHVLDGLRTWNNYFPTADIILAHPNGWGLKEQDFLKTAATASGWTRGNRIRFVTEGEASVHYCMFHADLAPRFQVS